MNKQQQAQKVFELLSVAIRSSAKFNNEKHAIRIEYGKLNKSVENVLKLTQCKSDHKKLIERIKSASEKIIKETVSNMKKDDESFIGSLKSFNSNIDLVLNSLDGKTGFLQGTLFAQKTLIGAVNQSSINQDLTARIQQIISEMIDVLNAPKPKLLQVKEALNNVSSLISSLQQYADDMELPTWFGELFLNKVNNSLVSNTNASSMQKINTSFDTLTRDLMNFKKSLHDDVLEARLQSIIDQSHVVQNNISQAKINAENISTAMQHNNNLLNRIESDIGYKKNMMQKVVDAAKEFKIAAQSAIILRHVRDKFEVEELKNLKITVNNMPKYFDSVTSIGDYQKDVKESSDLILACVENLKNLEKEINAKTNVAEAFYNIEKAINNLNASLADQMRAIDKNGSNSGIPASAFSWERSGWQKFKNFFAIISQSIIGESLHISIYGHPSGMEILRRTSEKIADIAPENTIEEINQDVFEDLMFEGGLLA